MNHADSMVWRSKKSHELLDILWLERLPESESYQVSLLGNVQLKKRALSRISMA